MHSNENPIFAAFWGPEVSGINLCWIIHCIITFYSVNLSATTFFAENYAPNDSHKNAKEEPLYLLQKYAPMKKKNNWCI